MTQEQRDRIAKLKSPNKDIKEIYALMDELGITYKKTSCSKCRTDYLNILREEAKLIEDAAEESAFNEVDENAEYRFIRKVGTVWKGKLYDGNTPMPMVREFVKHFPVGFYEKIEKEPHTEETINNEE